jgi:hypothetical protein
LGPGLHADNGLRGHREHKRFQWTYGKAGSLILVHYPLVTECHSPPLPCGCWGNWANTTLARNPKPSPHPMKSPDASRKGKAAYRCLGRRKRERQGQPILFLFHFLPPKKSHFPHYSSRRPQRAGKMFLCPSGTRHPKQREAGPNILMAAREQTYPQAPMAIPCQEWEESGGRELQEAPIPCP